MKARDKIKHTFSLMLGEEGYQAIHIADLVTRADVSRASFYVHFKDKEELLVTYVDEMFQAYFDEQESLLESMDVFSPKVGQAMFEVFESERKFSAIFLQDDVHPVLSRRFTSYVSRIFGRLFRSDESLNFSLKPDLQPYMMDFCAGAALAMLKRWVANDFQPSTDALGELYFSLVMDGTRSLMSK